MILFRELRKYHNILNLDIILHGSDVLSMNDINEITVAVLNFIESTKRFI